MKWPHRLWIYAHDSDRPVLSELAERASAAALRREDPAAQRDTFTPVDPPVIGCSLIATEALRAALDAEIGAAYLAGWLSHPVVVFREVNGGGGIAADAAGNPVAYAIVPGNPPISIPATAGEPFKHLEYLETIRGIILP